MYPKVINLTTLADQRREHQGSLGLYIPKQGLKARSSTKFFFVDSTRLSSGSRVCAMIGNLTKY